MNNAAKRIRKLMDDNPACRQLDILKQLALALQLKHDFNVHLLYEIDYSYFNIAMQLLEDWRLGHHIETRSKLMEKLFCEYPDAIMPTQLAEDALPAQPETVPAPASPPAKPRSKGKGHRQQTAG